MKAWELRWLWPSLSPDSLQQLQVPSFPVVCWPPGHEGREVRNGHWGLVCGITEMAFQETAGVIQISFTTERSEGRSERQWLGHHLCHKARCGVASGSCSKAPTMKSDCYMGSRRKALAGNCVKGHKPGILS